jgi:hypothetical protein
VADAAVGVPALSSQDFIRSKVDETVRKAGGHKHVLNLGHGARECAAAAAACMRQAQLPARRAYASWRVLSPPGVMPSTPEANVAAFFEAARTVHERVRM